mgnify:CR=1 FL=1|tara:strand:+ start:570 stop:869 length:300 start_codon:yes stop_codon:yes gene_type:complete
MLVSNVIVEKEQTSFLEDYFQFLLPFKADLWCAVILMFLLCTLALGFIEAELFIVSHLARISTWLASSTHPPSLTHTGLPLHRTLLSRLAPAGAGFAAS